MYLRIKILTKENYFKMYIKLDLAFESMLIKSKVSLFDHPYFVHTALK